MSRSLQSGDPIEGWLVAARNGSIEALGALLDECREYLLFVANREIDSELRAKVAPSDVVQESFVHAHAAFDRFVGQTDEELRAWLRRILVNNLATARRRYRATASRSLAREVALQDIQAMGPRAAELATDTKSPSKYASLQEERGAVEHVLAGLPAEYQELLRLRYWEQLPLAEIARRMNRTPNAVQKLWFRAIARFKREFAKDANS